MIYTKYVNRKEMYLQWKSAVQANIIDTLVINKSLLLRKQSPVCHCVLWLAPARKIYGFSVWASKHWFERNFVKSSLIKDFWDRFYEICIVNLDFARNTISLAWQLMNFTMMTRLGGCLIKMQIQVQPCPPLFCWFCLVHCLWKPRRYP